MNPSATLASMHFKEARLTEAIAAATSAVKANPSDRGNRILLCELLCFAGDLERADKQFDALSQLDPQLAVMVAMFRTLLRAAQARTEFFRAGRLPDFLSPPSPELQLRLQASILLREDSARAAAELLEQAETLRVQCRGTCDGVAFDDFRDLDDLTASFLEVLTPTGKYYWAPFEQIQTIALHPTERPLDLLWRKASLRLRSGTDVEVLLPVLYEGSAQDLEDRVRVGKVTEWRGGEESPVRGFGQKMLLLGETVRPILELNQIEFQEDQAA